MRTRLPRWFRPGLLGSAVLYCSLWLVHPLQAAEPQPVRPRIERLGTLDFGVSETTPVVFRDQLWRFEYINRKYHRARVPVDYFQFINTQTGDATAPFALDHVLGSAHVENDQMYVYGLRGGWGRDTLNVFWSADLTRWKTQEALRLPGYALYNNSVCKGPDGFVMALEAGGPPEVVGERFTFFFALSDDLKTWRFLGPDVAWTKARYVGCPAIRYHDGHYYMLYLERIQPAAGRYVYRTDIVRSADLLQWEASPINPVLDFSEDDRAIRNPRINSEQQQRIKLAPTENISDLDLAEFQGEVVLYYSWGSQQGIEYLAEARYKGTLGQFLTGFFPAKSPVK